MRSAYFFQALNLLVSILTVPLLLHYLPISDYVLWTLFTTLGSITLQFNNGIQPVLIREIAREYHRRNSASFEIALHRSKREYVKLAGFVAGPLLLFGGLYLHFVAGAKVGIHPDREWLVFVTAYAVNYYFAPSSAVLLGMARVAQQNDILSLTRFLYFAAMFLLLHAGYSIMGICIAFAVSVGIGCALLVRAANHCIAAFTADCSTPPDITPSMPLGPPIKTGQYILYTLSAFALYNGSLLFVVTLFPKAVVASYGLCIQTFTLLSAFAVVPVQVWLNKLVRAITAGDQNDAMNELAKTILVCNAIFAAALVPLAFFGNVLLGLLHSKVRFLSATDLTLMWLAFLVELNLLILASFLVSHRSYRFVRVYLSVSWPALALGVGFAWITRNLIISLIVVPMFLQAAVTLPIILRLASIELAVPPREFVARLRVCAVALCAKHWIF